MTEFYCGTRLYTGANALSALKNYPAQRVMVVTDGYFSQNGTARRIAEMVEGAEYRIFDEVTPDPSAEVAARAAAQCREFGPQLLIALGGGSPMDCAKAVRLASETPVTFLAIPTTSGSGSEVTSFSVLTHHGVKHPLVDPAMRPDAAILDETLLEQLPPSLIADTGMDLLSHCVEAVCGRGRSGFTDALAFHGVRTVFSCLAGSWHGDHSLRLQLHEGAAMAGIAFDNAGLGLCHAMAHALGGVFHLSHGKLCAMALPHVMACNEPSAGERYRALAEACGLNGTSRKMAVRSLSAAISRLRQSMQMPATLTQAGISRQDIENNRTAVIAAVLADSCLQTNPTPVTGDMVQELYKAVAG